MKKFNLAEREANQNTIPISKKLGEKMKKDWQKQNKGLKINVGDFVKLAVTDSNGTEHLWFEVKEVSPFTGRCDNVPIVIEEVRYNNIIPFKFEEIEDYVKKSNRKIALKTLPYPKVMPFLLRIYSQIGVQNTLNLSHKKLYNDALFLN